LLRISVPKHSLFYKALSNFQYQIWKKSKSYVLNHDDFDRYLYVDPQQIKNIGVGWGTYIKRKNFGKVVDGDWDLNSMPFEDLDVYQAIHERFIQKKEWEETNYYKRHKEYMNWNSTPYGLKSQNDIAQHFSNIDNLYKNILKSGYRTRRDIDGTNSLRILDEITVRISRTGELLFEDGRHRLSIAKILRIPHIPVLVTWRHKMWDQLRRQITSEKKELMPCLPIKHPDIDYIDEFYSAECEKKFQLIKSHLGVKTGTVLDIGARFGFFSHKFEDEGFYCYAVEKNKEKFDRLNRIRILTKKNFAAINCDVFEFIEKTQFDIVLALDVFQQSFKTKKDYEKLKAFLSCLTANIMFLEAPPKEAGIKNHYMNLTHEEFTQFVIDNSKLGRKQVIGYGVKGQPVYKIS